MISVKTLDVCSLIPANNDLWFLNTQTNRDYSIQESEEKACPECNYHEYDKYKDNIYELYCNNCGLVFNEQRFTYGSLTHDMQSLNNRSTLLKEYETQIKKINPDYNKKYRDFKHRYYNLFQVIAENDYNIPSGTANDLFYQYFRGFYDMNNRRGIRREKLVRRFLDHISINPREYFMTGQPVNEHIQQEYKNPEGSSRTPKVSEGQLNVTGKCFTGRKISYTTYLDVNGFIDSETIRMKYLSRYQPSHNIDIVKPSPEKDNRNPKYAFGSDKTPEVPTLNKTVSYNGIGDRDNVITSKRQDNNSILLTIKSRLPYYSTNLKTYTYTNIPENNHLQTKTENPSKKINQNKTEIKKTTGTLMTKRMNEPAYKNKIYHKKIGIKRKCSKCREIFITNNNRQLYCNHCHKIKTL